MHVVQLLKVLILAAQPLRTIQLAVQPQQALAAN
jgi:hypothetical protein